jgi:hypothetical protein
MIQIDPECRPNVDTIIQLDYFQCDTEVMGILRNLYTQFPLPTSSNIVKMGPI